MADEPVVDPTPQRPEYLLDKFQTEAEQARGYAEVEKKMRQMEVEMKEQAQSFTAALEGLQPVPAPQQFNGQQQQAFDPNLTAYATAYEQGDVAGMLAAQAQYTTAPVIDAVSRLLDERLSSLTPAVEAASKAQREHDIRLAEGLVERQLGPDKYAELLPRVKELIMDNPNWLPTATSVEGYAASIVNVAKLAGHDVLQRTVADFEQERAAKLAAQTLSGGYNRPAGNPDADRAEFERIKNTATGSFAEVLANAQRNAG